MAMVVTCHTGTAELEHQISDLRRKVQEATRAPQATGADVAANQLDRVEDIQEELKVAHLETEELQSHVAVADCRVQELEAEVEALQQQVLDGAVQVVDTGTRITSFTQTTNK